MCAWCINYKYIYANKCIYRLLISIDGAEILQKVTTRIMKVAGQPDIVNGKVAERWDAPRERERWS